MWRGQADAHWPLHSSGFRRILLSDPWLKGRESELIHYEESLLEQATHSGYRFHEGRLLTDIELLAKLQHHGAATRLVDMTRNVLIALYFSCREHMGTTGALIGIHSSYIAGFGEGRLVTDSYEALVKRLEKSDNVWTCQPTAVSARINAQHSQFLFSKVATTATGSLILPEGEATRIIAIAPDKKIEFLTILSEVFDIWTKTVFPDIDGFGLANSTGVPTNEMHRW